MDSENSEDGGEYILIKFRLRLKKNDTRSRKSSSSFSSDENQPKSAQTGTTKDVTYQRIEDANVLKNPYLTSSMLRSLSAPQLSTTESSTRINLSVSSKYSSSLSSIRPETKSVEDSDTCRNCSKLLMDANDFLTKIKSNYGIISPVQPTSTDTSSFGEKSWIPEESEREKILFAKNKKNMKISANIPIMAINDGVSISPPSTPSYVRRWCEFKQFKYKLMEKDNEESESHSVSTSTVDENITTPLDWMSASSSEPSKNALNKKLLSTESKHLNLKTLEAVKLKKKRKPKLL